MNLIKFKDIQRLGDDFFNKSLKGKYAYWIHMRYVVPLSAIGYQEYIAYENDINKLFDAGKAGTIQYADIFNGDMMCYADVCDTERANSVIKYAVANGHTTDENITLEEIMKFRTWLAASLLKLDLGQDGEPQYNIYNEKGVQMLKYYANGMYDEVVKQLSVFGGQNVTYNTVTSGCACSSSNLSSLYNTELQICDPVSIYKKNIKQYMIEMFSDVEFWKQMPKNFINEIKLYIDNIVQCNLKLTTDVVDTYNDCSCAQNRDVQSDKIMILKHLSESFDYIYKDTVLGHKNFIADTLLAWSTDLYELMEWYKN